MEDEEVALATAPGQPSEKSLTQSQVNEVVKREKAGVADRVRREMESKHREELERVRAETQGQSMTQGGAPAVDIDGIEQRVYDKFMNDLQTHRDALEKETHERELKSRADSFHLKMSKGSEIFDDYNEVMGDFKAHEFPNAALLAEGMPNTAEIMYELANNPSKLLEINSLAERSPGMAQKQLEKLSKSIEANIAAKQNNVSAPAPLSRLKSSTVGVDNGKMGLQDLKDQPWLKG
jgi:hypothetical protein